MNDQTNTPKFNRSDRSGYDLRQTNGSVKRSIGYNLRRGAGDAKPELNDENVENAVVNTPRRQKASRRLLGSQSIKNKCCNPFEVSAFDQTQSKKRRHSTLTGDEPSDEKLVKCKRRMKDCVFIELQPSGFEPDEEIVKFIAFHPTSSTTIGNFTFPTNPNKKVACKMSKLSGIEVDCRMMLCDNELVSYAEIQTVLEEFVKLIESLNSENIVLGAYHLRFASEIIRALPKTSPN